MNNPIVGRLSESRRKKLNERLSTWDSKTSPNNYSLDVYLRKSGYQLVDVSRTSKGDIDIYISPIKESYLTPDILWVVDHFEIEVISYGTVEVSDLEEIIKGYQTALSVTEYLMNVNLEALEV